MKFVGLLFAFTFLALPVHAKYGGGSGAAEDPYLIYTAEQMNAIGANRSDWGKHFKLMADIDLAAYTGTEFNIIGARFGDAFTGIFDGNGKKISNFNCTCTGTDYAGLFGYVAGVDAQIKDLGLIDPNVRGAAAHSVGSLVGFVREGTITACYAEAGSVSGNDRVGGLVGEKDLAAVTNCYSSAGVSASGYDVGGLVGYSSGKITNCYATGSVAGAQDVGGLVGDNSGTITNCYAAGSVTGTQDVGGLVGDNRGAVAVSFWDTQTSGLVWSAGGTGKTTADMQMASTFVAWGCQPVWTIDEAKDYPRLWWQNKPGEPIANPSPPFGGGSGTQDDPHLIYTPEQLNMIGSSPCHWYKHFKLMADIDLSGFSGTDFNAIGNPASPFTGVFDGNGHAISNSCIILFGYLNDPKARIEDLGLINPNVDAGTAPNAGALVAQLLKGTVANCYVEGGSVSGGSRTAGLVGYSRGTIINCTSSASVPGSINSHFVGGLVGENDRGTIINCHAAGSVSGHHFIGGLVGGNRYYSTITNCSSSAGASGCCAGGLVGFNEGGIGRCYAGGKLTGGCEEVGGLVGWNSSGVVSDCYSSTTVSGGGNVGGLVGVNGPDGIIFNCYATGSVAGSRAGGLVGKNTYSGIVAASFWDIQTSGQAISAGGTVLNTAQMQTQSTFSSAGWDFAEVWGICETTSYPTLRWQIVKADLLCPNGVTMIDYSLFASYWLDENCSESNDCSGADLDLSGAVDINDVAAFADSWVAGVE